MSSSECKKMRNYWENMMAGRCYTKGEFDSRTKQLVLVTRKGNYFSPDHCYFALVQQLPYGTCYIDCE